MSTASKAEARNRGRATDVPTGPSATPLPPPEPAPQDQDQDQATPADRPQHTPSRATAGKGRRGHLRNLSLERTPDDHDRSRCG